MMWQRLTTSLVVGLVLFLTTLSFAQEVQTPPEIKTNLLGIQDRFTAVLEEECPPGKCYPVGCEVRRFITIDQEETS